MSTQSIQVGINLLPPRFALRRKQRRTAIINLIMGIVILAALTVAWLGFLLVVNDVKSDRDAVQTQVATLESDVAALAQYRTQAEQLENSKANLAFAMAEEVSWAQILNDLTMTVPHTTSLSSFTASLNAAETAQARGDGSKPYPVGTMQTSGYTIEQYSPGIESVLTRFAESTAYIDGFVPSASVGEIAGTSVHNFSASFDISSKAYTKRYANGLPETEQ